MSSYDLPTPNTAEITLIGTGGGYGECGVIHLTNGKWMIVDSCQNPSTKQVLPLLYLNKIGVDLNDVVLIVCTHWHDDHIQGLSEILRQCTNAQFAMARANDLKKFLEFVNLDAAKVIKEPSNASTTEFLGCLTILKERGKHPVWAGQDRILESVEDIQVISLSPSDLTINKFDQEISLLITEFGKASTKVQISSPNAKSVALYLKLGNHRAILGADLEVSVDPGEGWSNVVTSCKTIDRPASLVKIAHHGSENGYYLDLWLNHVTKDNPVAKLTPWNKNKGLPLPHMLDKYLTHTNNLFITSEPKLNKAKKRSKSVDKLVKQFNSSVQEVKFSHGIIRSRINRSDCNDSWQVDCFDAAYQILGI